MIFPQFKNTARIDSIRSLYDPLAALVRPHITLAFPFESPMTNDEWGLILDRRLQGIRPFELTLYGLSKHADHFGHYLFLNISQGKEELIRIHRDFYDNEFRDFHNGFQHIPHMTVGKLPTAELLNKAFDSIPPLKETFTTVVSKISVEMIGDHDESIIVLEKELK